MGADPAKAGEFDGEEPTNVINQPSTPPPPEEPENKDRAYFAPRAVPRAAVPRDESEAPKIVLNLPDAKVAATSTEVAAARARRRAATVKISRGALGHHGLPSGPTDGDAADDDLAPEPTLLDIPIDVEAMGAPGSPPPVASAVAPRPPPPRAPIAPVEPMALSPERSALPRLAPHGEPPAIARAVQAPPRERSRAPWIIAAVLVFSGIGVGAFVMTGGAPRGAAVGASDTSKASPTAQPAATTALPAATTAAAPASTTAIPSASETAAPSAAASLAPDTAAPIGAPPPSTVAGAPTYYRPPTAGPTSTWKPPATGGARPTFGAGKKPTSDIPTGI